MSTYRISNTNKTFIKSQLILKGVNSTIILHLSKHSKIKFHFTTLLHNIINYTFVHISGHEILKT